MSSILVLLLYMCVWFYGFWLVAASILVVLCIHSILCALNLLFLCRGLGDEVWTLETLVEVDSPHRDSTIVVKQLFLSFLYRNCWKLTRTTHVISHIYLLCMLLPSRSSIDFVSANCLLLLVTTLWNYISMFWTYDNGT